MSIKKYNKKTALVPSSIANLPFLVKEIKVEADRIRGSKKQHRRSGYLMKTNNRVYKM